MPRRRLVFLRATAGDERDIGKKECRVNGGERERGEKADVAKTRVHVDRNRYQMGVGLNFKWFQ